MCRWPSCRPAGTNWTLQGSPPAKRARSGSPTCIAPAPPAPLAPKPDTSAERTNVIAAPDDATTAIPVAGRPVPQPATDQIPADETRAIPVSRPEGADSDVATEKLNARGKQGGGLSAQDLLRREGRL